MISSNLLIPCLSFPCSPNLLGKEKSLQSNFSFFSSFNLIASRVSKLLNERMTVYKIAIFLHRFFFQVDWFFKAKLTATNVFEKWSASILANFCNPEIRRKLLSMKKKTDRGIRSFKTRERYWFSISRKMKIARSCFDRMFNTGITVDLFSYIRYRTFHKTAV